MVESCKGAIGENVMSLYNMQTIRVREPEFEFKGNKLHMYSFLLMAFDGTLYDPYDGLILCDYSCDVDGDEHYAPPLMITKQEFTDHFEECEVTVEHNGLVYEYRALSKLIISLGGYDVITKKLEGSLMCGERHYLQNIIDRYSQLLRTYGL